MADQPQSVTDKLGEAAAGAAERVKEVFSGTTESARDNIDSAREQAAGGGAGNRTAGDRASDLLNKADDATNRAADSTREFAADEKQRLEAAYEDTKAVASENVQRAKDSATSAVDTASAHLPGRNTQDPAAVEASGVNPGYETARDYAEKTEDV